MTPGMQVSVVNLEGSEVHGANLKMLEMSTRPQLICSCLRPDQEVRNAKPKVVRSRCDSRKSLHLLSCDK